MYLITQKYTLRLYLIFFISSFFILIINYFLNISPWVFLLTVLFLIFLPGFALSRIFKITFSNDWLGQVISWLALGLIFNLTISLLAILLGLTITILLQIYFLTIIALFLIAFILDLFQPNSQKLDSYNFDIKKLFKFENLIYIFFLLLVILVIATVNQIGGNFKSDSQYHIAIMRKAIGNFPLTIDNLSFVKNQIDLAYGLPVWHVFLSLTTKVLKTNIFTLWTEISTVLTLLVFLVWSWFFWQFLPNRQVRILAVFLFITYYFALDGYFYTRLAVPDILNQLLLLPLSFGLSLKYIFDRESNYKHLIVLSLIIFFMGVIHWSQYFYFLIGMGLFGLIYLVFQYQEKDFWPIFKKIIQVVCVNLVLVVPTIIFLELKSHAVLQNLQIFPNIITSLNNNSFIKFNSYVQFSFLFLPFTVLFLKRYRQLIFVIAVFLVGILVFNIPHLSDFLAKYLSPIFIKRLYTNLGEWPYVIWALFISFIFVLLDRVIKFTKSSYYIINFLLLICLGTMLYLEVVFQAISIIYNQVFSDSTKVWIGDNYYWLISFVVISALILFFVQKYNPKWDEFFKYQDYRNNNTILILILITVLFLGSRSVASLKNNFKKELVNGRFFSDISADPVLTVVNINRFGGQETIDFIKNDIPAKSIFNSSGSSNMVLPMLVDVYMASFPFGQESMGAYQNLYRTDVPIQDRLKSLKNGKIEYVLYAYSNNKPSPFVSYPQYFTKIYDNGNAAIYKVEKEQVEADTN